MVKVEKPKELFLYAYTNKDIELEHVQDATKIERKTLFSK